MCNMKPRILTVAAFASLAALFAGTVAVFAADCCLYMGPDYSCGGGAVVPDTCTLLDDVCETYPDDSECGEDGYTITVKTKCSGWGSSECHQSTTGTYIKIVYNCYCRADGWWDGDCRKNIEYYCYIKEALPGCQLLS